MFRRLQRYMCKCSWKQLDDAAVIRYIHFTGYNGFVCTVIFSQRLDLILEDFSNLSDSVIHFA